MTVITERGVINEDASGAILFKTAGTTRLQITPSGAVVFAADTTGGTIKSTVGGVASITAGSAATAGGASALSAFQIPHGLAATPSIFTAMPNNAQSVAAASLGAYVTADATNVYYNTIASVTASAIYKFVWSANP